jgi:hypothetical protein
MFLEEVFHLPLPLLEEEKLQQLDDLLSREGESCQGYSGAK